MDEASALIGIAEIAVAIAGFSGVATALGHRSDAQFWSPGQRSRFIDLILHCAIALFASLIPLVLSFRFGVDGEFWVRSSLIWAFFGCCGIGSALMRGRRLPGPRGIEKYVVRFVLLSFVGLVVLQLYNVLVAQAFWPFLAALVGNLGFAFIQFTRMIVPRTPAGDVAD